MTTFQIKYGLNENISKATPVEGCWYVTTDTHELYFCADGQNIQKINAVETFDPTPIYNKLETIESDIINLKQYAHESVVTVDKQFNLPAVGREDIVYIVTSENAAYRWATVDGVTNYICIGRDYTEIEYIDCGNARNINK